ncbi:MAG: putative DNA binding domain-containing protein [Christensenellaceae bacterium]|jgi:ATP-dependent DNA helicase RecG|nr:putative DNA binding domain-containing protein [Christensenellaceae bacterium]
MANIFSFLKAETTACEFKEILEVKKPKSWLKSVSAFANGLGGSIYFGVKNNGEVVGLANIKNDSEKISEFIKARIEPSVMVVLETLNADGKDVLHLHVPSGTSTPYYYTGDGGKEAYYRMGNDSTPATQNILMELTLKGSHQSFDALNSNKKFADYSFTHFEATYREKTGLRLESPRDYISFGLLFDNKNLTYAGAMLADQHLVYNSRIFCTHWMGLTKTSKFEAKDDAEFEGNIIKLLNEGLAFVRRNSAIMWRKTPNWREEFPDYPHESVKEALVNAIVHREYIIKGSEIHIDMYDDRTEIVSPGAMFDGHRIQDVDINSVASTRRNPTLCDIFTRMHFMENRGSGLKKICAGYPTDKKPTFYSTPQSFIVKLPNLNYDKIVTSNGELIDAQRDDITNGITNPTLNTAQIKILKMIKDKADASAEQISEFVGIAVRNIKENIKILKDNNYIASVGGTRDFGDAKMSDGELVDEQTEGDITKSITNPGLNTAQITLLEILKDNAKASAERISELVNMAVRNIKNIK